MPAVQRVREAARRAECKNHLKQIGIAIAGYAEIHGTYPASSLLTGSSSSHNYFSQHTFVLPHLDQHALFNAINFAYSDDAPNSPLVANSTARLTRVGTLLCPSEVTNDAGNSYYYNLGRFYRESKEEGDGPLGVFRPLRPSDTTDGLHRTAFVSERVAGSYAEAGGDARRDIAIHAHIGPPPFTSNQIRQHCQNTPVLGWFPKVGRYWFYRGTFNTTYNHEALPNDPEPSCEVYGGNLQGRGGLYGARSFHPGGVNVLLGDGSVQFISNQIDTTAWEALGTRSCQD